MQKIQSMEKLHSWVDVCKPKAVNLVRRRGQSNSGYYRVTNNEKTSVQRTWLLQEDQKCNSFKDTSKRG